MNNIVTAVTGVFTAMGNWIMETLGNMTKIFYVPESGLTFLGTLSVCGLAVGICLLVVGIIQKFLSFRG